jgi:ABC-type Mn2+/Zn2+ transport system permease subunit
MAITEAYPIILAVAAALAAGLVGSFALMKRMTLAGDVMSHIALPGLGLALMFKIAPPVIGGAATLLLGAVLIWQLQKSSTLTTDTTIGVVFAAALALGVLLTPGDELIDALFGNFGPISSIQFALGVIAIVGIIGFILTWKDHLILALFSPELAAATGVNISRLDLYFLIAFALTIISGLQFLGALLMGALIIVPAATGRQLTHTLPGFLIVSSVVSVIATGLGIFVISHYNIPTEHLGPVVVSVSAGLFLLSLLKKKR